MGFMANPESETNPWIESHPVANGVYEAQLKSGHVVIIARVSWNVSYVYNTIQIIEEDEKNRGTYRKLRTAFDTSDLIRPFTNEWIEHNTARFRPVLIGE